MSKSPLIYPAYRPFQFLVAYPIQQGKLINVAGIDPQYHLENTKHDGPSVVAADRSELISLFKDFEPEVQTLVKVCAAYYSFHRPIECFGQNADQISKWAIYTVKPMNTFVHNNVALMGDAVSICWSLLYITNILGPRNDSLPWGRRRSSSGGTVEF